MKNEDGEKRKMADAKVILAVLSSEANVNAGGRDSGFREAIERALGAEVLRTLQRVTFEEDADLGAAMTFEFGGNELCIEKDRDGYVSLKRIEVGMPVICLLELSSENFREEFYGALATAIHKGTSGAI
jgi:hypothetical protein